MTSGAVAHAWVRDLGDPGAGLGEVGGKGESLARMIGAGLPVPGGFHLTTWAYRDFVEGHDLQPQIEAQAARAAQGEPEEASAAIRALFVEHEPPEALRAGVTEAYDLMGAGAVAVRSSATAEDLPGLSFAGQQDTFLNVEGVDALLSAVKQCWASLWTARAMRYRARARIPTGEVSIAVVVQRLVAAEVAGIMFTADPVSGDPSRLHINAAFGLGEAVVGGQVTPDSYLVDAGTGRLTAKTVSEKLIMTVPTSSGTEERPVPVRRRTEATLTDPQAEGLAVLGRRLAALYGRPMDVEWALAGGEFTLLQARPITTGAERDPWNDSREVNCLWTNTNVGEAIPDVMTPATWHLVQEFLAEAMTTSANEKYKGFGQVGGRLYLNLSMMMSLSAALGISERRFRRMTQEVFGPLPDGLAIPKVRLNRVELVRTIVPIGLRVVLNARRDLRRLGAYIDAHPALCDRLRAEIATTETATDLVRLWRETLDPAFHEGGRMLSASTKSSGTSFVLTRQALRTLVGEADANAITAGMGKETGELASLGLLMGLEKLANGEIDRDTFNRTYGHRGPHELEVSMPRPGEQPDWVDEQLRHRRPGDRTARELLARQERARDEAWARLQRTHPHKAARLQRKLTVWSRIAREREAARTEVVRLFWVLRDYLLRAGKLTGLGDDVFFLDLDEVAAVLDGTEPDLALIGQRRDAYRRYAELPPLPSLISGRFDPFSWAADPERRSDLFVEGGGIATSETISGSPGSEGVVVGTARVLADFTEGAALRPGEVLVTNITNVGWTPLFPRVAAVVTDIGAPLSHAAIVARELGIPAVVGCGNATMRIRTGDRIRVDGSAGTVAVLDRREEALQQG
ncbi:hypothetical protein GCM10009841_06760 [Microlunatus panaciterrae]|uniref:Pyruvate,water dikinase n=1 Tax=Microlunatus panaciterrae TaxID=400768 RepID=A0ABS2RI44_9ACTN|nr:PEP/pyruvate-binding domain-containing protein [Microlunatus panaciterrae]MBM7798670.1 pyruvate,water dikinase [Microlunatus panaciterrae]